MCTSALEVDRVRDKCAGVLRWVGHTDLLSSHEALCQGSSWDSAKTSLTVLLIDCQMLCVLISLAYPKIIESPSLCQLSRAFPWTCSKALKVQEYMLVATLPPKKYKEKCIIYDNGQTSKNSSKWCDIKRVSNRINNSAICYTKSIFSTCRAKLPGGFIGSLIIRYISLLLFHIFIVY